MKKNYILIILISLFVLSPKLYAQVECPCDFESVPKTTGCWVEQRLGGSPEYVDRSETSKVCFVRNIINEPFVHTNLAVGEGRPEDEQPSFCRIELFNVDDCNAENINLLEITPRQVKACQCELLAYTTALNEVAGISVSGGPPYECGNVDLQICADPTPIPTLNEYGMIIMAGVLGLLAVIGLFVMRRRKVTA